MNKVVIICFWGFLIQVISGQLLSNPLSGPCRPVLTSASLGPAAMSICSDDLLISGPIVVSGKLPFSGSVGLEGSLPAAGVGTEAFSFPLNGFNVRPTATVATGNAVTTVGGCLGPPQTSTVPLVTEILPSLQFGDVNLAGDIPIGGTIKVSGCFPVYGVVSVDGAVPSAGTAVINTGGGLVASVFEGCRC